MVFSYGSVQLSLFQVSKGEIGPSHGLVFVLDDLKRYGSYCGLTVSINISNSKFENNQVSTPMGLRMH